MDGHHASPEAQGDPQPPPKHRASKTSKAALDRQPERRQAAKGVIINLNSEDFEVGLHDGRTHTVVPFWGRGKLSDRQQQYYDVHGWYRTRAEHICAQLWQWKVVRNVWQGGEQELHETMRILLHMEHFVNNRTPRYQPYGPWPHVPEGLWSQKANEVLAEEVDSSDTLSACQLCASPGV